MELRVEGTEQLADVAKALRTHGAKGLRKELLAGIRKAGKPLLDDARNNARGTLPSGGGLAERVAGGKFGVRTRTAGKSAGVRLQSTNTYAIEEMDEGRLRHPVFGGGAWVSQSVTPGWWSKSIEKGAPGMRAAIVHVMDDVAKRIERAV